MNRARRRAQRHMPTVSVTSENGATVVRDIKGLRIPPRGRVQALWTVERGCLDKMLRDRASHAYVKLGVPLTVAFEDAADAEDFKRRVAAGTAW